MGFNGGAYGAAKKLIVGIESGFKTAYSNPDGSYSIEFLDGTIVTTTPIKGDKGDKGDKGNTGDKGIKGVGVVSVEKTGTSGLVDSYTMTFSDGSTTVFSITNGANIERLSQLQNDENFITNTVNNLVNYYTKSEIYNKSKIDELLRNIGAGLGMKIVTELPTEDISGTTIYLINVSDNNYNQYMYIDGDWANLGSTNVNLSDYYTKTQLDDSLLAYIDEDTLTTILEGYVTKSELGDVATSNDYNDLDNLPTIPSTDAFMKGRQKLDEVDLDECVIEGIYAISPNSANLPSVEIDEDSVDLQVSSIEILISQTVRLISDGKPMTYLRYRVIDQWTDWVYAISSDVTIDADNVNITKGDNTKKSLQAMYEDMELGGGSDEYSTTEKVIGKWIDGKPIYRISGVTTTSTLTNAINITTIDNVIRSDVHVYTPDYIYGAMAYVSTTSNRTCFEIRSNGIILLSNMSFSKVVFTFEYTKKTD